MLTAIKEVVTSQVARALMGLFGGTRGYAPAGAGGGGGGVLGALFGGIGIFGGGGAGGGGFPGLPGPGGTPPFLPGGAGASGGGGASGGFGSGGILSGANWAASLANLKSFAGIGGSVQLAPGVATTWQAATMGQKLSSIGKSNAALLGGGLLIYEGLRRGGAAGVGMSAAGGALIGFKYGGPLGAAIGGIAGAAAGIVRLFVKGAEEKARQKIKAVYGVDISDKAILKQIVETAKSAYGGNLDVAIQSQQVRELVELYAMTTGQTYGGKSTQVQPFRWRSPEDRFSKLRTIRTGPHCRRWAVCRRSTPSAGARRPGAAWWSTSPFRARRSSSRRRPCVWSSRTRARCSRRP